MARTQHLRIPRWLPVATLVAFALASTLTCLGNEWVQDDLPIIRDNALIHTLRIWPLFTQAYWPVPYPRELYRPLTSSLFAFEWWLGHGSPVLFRITSILLYLAATLAVYRLARRIANPGVAWLAAAFFAVHPVHVEAVAVAVNQAEIIVGALMALLVTSYIDRRRAGTPLTARWIAGMSICYFAAALFKEHALLLLPLLLCADATVIDDARPWRERVTALRPLFLMLLLVAVSVVGIRSMALGGDTKGSFTAEALGGLGFGGRALTMLGVVPQWFRLWSWPDHLRADYSPQEFVAATHWGLDQTLGALLLVITAVTAVLAWRRKPAITFGILWTVVAMLLVSNIIVPTGILIAERTLFLSTIGVTITAALLIMPVATAIYGLSSITRIGVVTATVVLFAMAISRSALRQRVWHDVVSLWYQTVIDAPKSYRAQQAYGAVLFGVGMERSGEQHYHIAMQLFPKGWPLYLELADKLRERGRCEAAIGYYRQVLLLTPPQSGVRASEVACLLYLGDYRKAAFEARMGASYDPQKGLFGLYAQIADSALRVNAPPHSIALPAAPDSLPPHA